MTRRGSLVYYLAAWICGCFFMSAAIWARDLIGQPSEFVTLRGVFGLLFFYFYGLSLGAVAVLLGAFLLRRLMLAVHGDRAWQWTLAGAILAPAILSALGVWWNHGSWRPQPAPVVISAIAYGPAVVLDAGWWLAIPAGAATAFVLYRIHRAFAPKPSDPPAASPRNSI